LVVVEVPGGSPIGGGRTVASASDGSEALFRDEHDPMHRLAFTLLAGDDDAAEVVQEAFVTAGARWDEIANPGGYLRTCVVNGCRRTLRTRDARRMS
jgi:DNA-directed RNA polymerase specialized sigma24 family protein